MNTSEILELVRAGYTKAEIESLSGAEIQKEDTETANQKDTETANQKEVKPDNGYKELLDVVNSLKETVKAMQADNAKKASGEPPQKETAESAIRSFFEDTPKN